MRVIKIRDDILLIYDHYKGLLRIYDTLNEKQISECKTSEHVWSIRRVE